MNHVPSNVYEEPKDFLDGLPYVVHGHVQFNNGKHIMAKAHIHDYIEILYCTDGAFKTFLNGIEYHFGEDDMLLINSREIHHIFSDSDGINRYIVLKIDPRLLHSQSQSIFETKFVLPFTLGHAGNQRVFKKAEIGDTCVPELVNEILTESTVRNYGYELAVKAAVCRLFVWILRYWETKNVDLHYEISDSLLRSFSEVLDEINTNYKENITAFDMAEKTNLSYSYFSRMFKRITGRSFSEYLNAIRISEAEKLLVTTDMTVTEVAMETGFCDTCYFISKFKSSKGTTPKQFKKEHTLTPMGSE